MYKYSFQGYDKETMARAVALSIDISTKHAIEISNYIRGRKLSTAKKLLELAIQKKKAIPFKRFTEGAGHKSTVDKVGRGKYVVKASRQILKLLKEVETNAMQKGIMDPVIIHIAANRASTPYHYGRKPGRSMKRTHIEIVVKGEVDKKLLQKIKAEKEKKQRKAIEQKVEEVKKDHEQVSKGQEKTESQDQKKEESQKEKEVNKKQEKQESKEKENKAAKKDIKTTSKATDKATKKTAKKTTKKTTKKSTKTRTTTKKGETQ